MIDFLKIYENSLEGGRENGFAYSKEKEKSTTVC